MKPKTIVIIAMLVAFAVGVSYALLREVDREESTLGQSISGIVEVAPTLYAQGIADIVRTDRVAIFLVDPETREPVAMRTESPLVPPQNIRIGQADARGGNLQGSYIVIGIVDKDGEIFKVTPGEVYGRSDGPVPLGTEKFKLTLDEPYRGNLFNEAAPQMAATQGGQAAGGAPGGSVGSGEMPADHPPMGNMPGGGMPGMQQGEGPARPLGEGPEEPKFSVQGTIRVKDDLRENISPSDKLIILLFDPVTPRPAAFKIIPHTLLPQEFSVTLPPQARNNVREQGYSLRVITDKNDNPFGDAPGELVGRSDKLIPLGTTGVELYLDQPYKR